MRGDMGELIGPGNIAASKDIGIERGEILIGDDRARGLDAQLFEAIAGQPRGAADREDKRVEGEVLFAIGSSEDDMLACGIAPAAQRSRAGQHGDAAGALRRQRQRRDFRVFARKNALALVDLRYLCTKPGECLRQLRPDRPAAEHDHAAWHRVHLGERLPQRVAGDIADLVEPRQIGNDRRSTGGDNDAARG